jgi:hypothetical protein
MGNGALPNGPSYRAYPRLYLNRHSATAVEYPLFGGKADIGWRVLIYMIYHTLGHAS